VVGVFEALVENIVGKRDPCYEAGKQCKEEFFHGGLNFGTKIGKILLKPFVIPKNSLSLNRFLKAPYY
jgi:hypothetical protein